MYHLDGPELSVQLMFSFKYLESLICHCLHPSKVGGGEFHPRVDRERRSTTSELMVIICQRLSRIDVADNGISIHTIRTIVDCVHKLMIYGVQKPK